MEWITDPAIWVGFFTLVVLEIVLGIDNLIFIAILADKLPPEQRDRARIIGLSLALVMRLGLLASISWIMSLTAPLFAVFGLEFSWRDLILIGGGLFLLIKATIEIHDRLEGQPHTHTAAPAHAAFWPVVAQIVVLDAVFSLDSVITAIGMVDDLKVMMAAVVVAMIVMLAASKPLTRFVNAHPSLVILCLGFLLMIGFALMVDGFGLHIPKGYLYAAIGFAIVIETFNQLALRNRRKWAAAIPQRQRIADAVIRLIGGVPMTAPGAGGDTAAPEVAEDAKTFTPIERRMVRGVLALANRPVRSIMTPRPDVVWIAAGDDKQAVLATVRESPHRQFIVSRGSIDEVAGVVRKEDILDLCLGGGPFDLAASLRQQPVAVPETTSVLDALNLFKGRALEMALVVDEYGSLQGVVTQTDLLQAITGDLQEEGNEQPEIRQLEDDVFEIDGATSIYDAQEQLGLGLLPEGDFHTVAGFVLFLFNRIPAVGEHVDRDDWRFEVREMDGLRIDKVLARRIGGDEAPATSA